MNNPMLYALSNLAKSFGAEDRPISGRDQVEASIESLREVASAGELHRITFAKMPGVFVLFAAPKQAP